MASIIPRTLRDDCKTCALDLAFWLLGFWFLHLSTRETVWRFPRAFHGCHAASGARSSVLRKAVICIRDFQNHVFCDAIKALPIIENILIISKLV